MWISSFAIRNPPTTVVVTLVLVLFGVLSLRDLETDEFPAVRPPVLTVSIAYPGAAPEVVEREVVVPLEAAFHASAGADSISSTAMDGFAEIVVRFRFDKNLDAAVAELREQIAARRRDLPPEIEPPEITRADPNDVPVVVLSLSSTTAPLTELTRIADTDITGALRGVPGVADLGIVGGTTRELTVELEPEALAASGVGVAEVVEALSAHNVSLPVGRLDAALTEETIHLRGRLETPADFAAMAVRETGGRVVRLGEVARVEDGAAEPRTLGFDGLEPAVGISVKKAPGASTTRVSADIQAEVEALRRTLPRGVRLRVIRDGGIRVAQAVHDVERSLFEGALLTVLVVFLFLRSWRSTVITGLALPVSVLASFTALRLTGFTLNTMSLLGLSLAIGLLVDDAIVVRENIVRHIEAGSDHRTAARAGTAEIGRAVAATTFAVVVVFLPIALMGGLAGQWFAPFALTIVSSVLVSLLVSFSLDPMLSATWPDPGIRRRGPLDGWVDRQTARYRRLVDWALDHPLPVAAVAAGTLAVALALPALGVVQREMFPPQDRGELAVHLETPEGSSLAYTRAKLLEAIAATLACPEVAYTYAAIGGRDSSSADIFVKLRPHPARAAPQDGVARRLRHRLRRIAGATAALGEGGPAEKQIELELSGPDLSMINDLAASIAARIAGVPGLTDVDASTGGARPGIEVELDRAMAARLGVTPAQVGTALRTAFAGVDAGDWVDPDGEKRDVMVRLAQAGRRTAADLASLPILVGGSGSAARPVPLGQVARLRATTAPAQIWRRDRRRVVTIGANTDGRPIGAIMPELERRLRTIPLARGYAIRQGGEPRSQADLFSRVRTALGLAVALMYLVLVIQFRSFLDPIPVMASLPLALVGAMLALWATGSTLNMMSAIGVLMLLGVVAKNAILLVDFARRAIDGGADPREAIVQAGEVRLRPILMTSVAIVAGMLPVALGGGEGGDFRAPLGRAVIGGVVTSTLLTLIAIPSFYLALVRPRRRGGGVGPVPAL